MTENQRLSNIMEAYANIWADVILEKKLPEHLEKVAADITQLNGTIDEREHSNLEVLRYYRIVNHLCRLREIIRSKIGVNK